MNRLTDDLLCEAIETNTYIEAKNLKEMKKQPSMQDLYVKLNKYEKLEKELGCPLDVVIKAVKQATFKGLYFDTVDTDGYKRKGFIKCYLDYDGFTNRFFWNTGWNGDVWLSSHKKTWWLKEDKEE